MLENHLRIEENYLIGICAYCQKDIFSNEKWSLEKNKPCHNDCSIEEEIEIGEEFNKKIKDMGLIEKR